MVAVSLELSAREKISKVMEFPLLACEDQTGKIPARSRSGNNYLLVPRDCDENAILAEPTQNRKIKTLQKYTLKLLD